jgi:asparagine synthase (glutamine-hydrolysing)
LDSNDSKPAAISMMASLEVRCPLLDHELAEMAFQTAAPLEDCQWPGILLKAVGDRLPPEVVAWPKMGFSVPLADWFRGPLRELLWDHLTSPRFYQRGIVHPQFLQCLLEEHQTGRRNNQQLLWSLLVLEIWFQPSGVTSPQPLFRPHFR